VIVRWITPVTFQPDITQAHLGIVGLGDMNPSFFFSPSKPGALIWGIGPARVSQEDTVIRKGQKAGHVAGLVAAAVTGTMPLILTGTVAGRLVGKLMDHGITSKFVKTVKQQTEPGTSALILLADSDPERRQSVIDRLQLYEPRVLEPDLPADLEREIAESNNKNAA
jgi:uncharacterized membrane protein